MADTSWRNRKTLILSRSEMIGLLEPEEYVRCVETAFRRMGEGRVFMEPKGHIVLDKYPGEWEIMPSYIEEPEAAPAAAACKWVSIRFENRAKFNLPTVFSILIYTEPETGFPLAIVDGTHHTLMRTGASGAVSVKWMARDDSSVLALVGAGDVNTGAFRTCVATHDWKEVRPWEAVSRARRSSMSRSCAARESSSTTCASASPTAKSTCHSPEASFRRATSRAISAR